MSVFEQYGLTVYRTTRGRGAFICETDKGIHLLREVTQNEEKFAKEDYVTRELKSLGYGYADTFCRTLEGKLLAEDEGYKRYYIKDWFAANECDVKNYHDIMSSCRAIAMMHKYLDGVTVPETKEHIAEKDEGIEERRGTAGVNIAPSVCGTSNVSEAQEITQQEPQEILEKKAANLSIPVAEKLETRYQRKLKEMCSVRNYLRKKKGKSDFERLAYEYLVEYIKEGEEALDLLSNVNYEKIYQEALERKSLIHGSCNHHNILIGKGYEAVVNYEKVSINVPIVDLYDYMRKILEKYQWDIKLAYKLLDEYDQENRIGENDIKVLLCLFAFPEKFFKVMDHYYNSSKAWLPEKDMEKLKQALAQNEARRRFVESLK